MAKKKPGKEPTDARIKRERVIAGKAFDTSDLQKPAPGARTSSYTGGFVKRDSEEARLRLCPECGCGAGRHSRFCSRLSGS